MKIIHILESKIPLKVKDRTHYFRDLLNRQGFIHCCLPEQVDFVIETWFPGKNGLILLEIESKKLKSRLVFENLEGELEKFPHIYGLINTDAIIAWYPFQKN